MSINVIKSLSALGCAICTVAAANAASAQTKVNIVHALAADFLPAFIAKDTGCFAAKGLDATLTLLPIINNVPAALLSGSAQIGVTSPPVQLQAVENGLDLVAIAGGTRMSTTQPTMSVVVRQEVKAQTAQDLKGKRIAVPGLSSLGDISFRKWLMNNGVKPTDLTIIEAPMPQLPDLLKGGTVDAVVVVEPLRSRIVNGGIGYRHPQEYYPATFGDSLITNYIATGAWAKANAPAIAGFRACLVEGIDFMKSNPTEAKKIEEKYLKVTTPIYPVYSASVTAQDLKVHADVATELGLLRKPANLEAMVLK